MIQAYKKGFVIVISILLLLAFGVTMLAISNPTVDNFHAGAGGSSSGGGFTMTGSFGQHDASSSLRGGEFKLNGGLWGAGGLLDRIFLPLMLRNP